jgi:hypothetical protein
MLIIKKKSKNQKWYEQHKQELSEKRKKRYAEDPEYRQRAVEGSRRYRRGELAPAVPADAAISFSEAAKRVGIGTSTLREWRGKDLFPEPRLHRGRLWFTEHQVALLKNVKEFFRKYGKRRGKVKNDEEKRVRESISGNWH